MNNATTKTGSSDMDQANAAAAKLRATKPSKRAAAFEKLPAHIQHLATVPCCGEVHSNAMIDGGCALCANYSWGRMLRPEA